MDKKIDGSKRRQRKKMREKREIFRSIQIRGIEIVLRGPIHLMRQSLPKDLDVSYLSELVTVSVIMSVKE